ncbi:shikimate dehydrogenase [[Eubacterium] cellulosolvens]
MELPIKDGEKIICGVIGNPLKHSLSPLMHNAAFGKLGLNYVYLLFEIPKSALENTLVMLKAKGEGFRGASVTHPFKIEVMKHLNSVDDLAKEIGAVNTIVNNDGNLVGYNTDAAGAMEALKNNGVKLEGQNKRFLILGAGGAARAVAVPLAKLGHRIIIANRTYHRAIELAERLSDFTESKAVKIGELDGVIKEVEVLINCTSVGMKGGLPGTPVPIKLLNENLIVFDIIYSPQKTPLITAAEDAGAQVIYGHEMFIHQGEKAFELWTGKTAPVEVMREAVLKELGNF